MAKKSNTRTTTDIIKEVRINGKKIIPLKELARLTRGTIKKVLEIKKYKDGGIIFFTSRDPKRDKQICVLSYDSLNEFQFSRCYPEDNWRDYTRSMKGQRNVFRKMVEFGFWEC